MEYKSNKNVVYSCKYHVVWCPKYRRKVLFGKVKTRLEEVLLETSETISVDIIEMEIMPDHVHLLLDVDPQHGIQKAGLHSLRHTFASTMFLHGVDVKPYPKFLDTRMSASHTIPISTLLKNKKLMR
jgi:putative transposase